jgi:hypothetical protein
MLRVGPLGRLGGPLDAESYMRYTPRGDAVAMTTARAEGAIRRIMHWQMLKDVLSPSS